MPEVQVRRSDTLKCECYVGVSKKRNRDGESMVDRGKYAKGMREEGNWTWKVLETKCGYSKQEDEDELLEWRVFRGWIVLKSVLHEGC